MLRENLRDLMARDHLSQKDVAGCLDKDKSWLNKILNGDRGVQIDDLDALANVFGLMAYQLFQPGAARATERRSGHDRRSGRERRVSHHTRRALELDAEVRAAHPRRQSDAATLSSSEAHLVQLVRQSPDLLETLISLVSAKAPKPDTKPRHGT